MSRKRTNLDTAEAEFLYANTLVEFSKYKSFQELSIPERNILVDNICIVAIKKSCRNEEHIEAVTQEITSYSLTKDEEIKFYSNAQYTKGLEKPENFQPLLEKKYLALICSLVGLSFNDN